MVSADATTSNSSKEENIDHDDLCPICHLLLYKPVRTRCNHTLCEPCMAQWADVSITSQMTRVGLDDEATVFLPHEIETRCPMCRTLTNSVLDPTRERLLQMQYPSSYQVREGQSRAAEEDEFGSTIETLTVYIGNEHSEIRADEGSNNKHQWKFFIRPSRSDLLEEVQIFLVSLHAPVADWICQPVTSAPYFPQPDSRGPMASVRSQKTRLGLLHYLCKSHPQSRLQLGFFRRRRHSRWSA